MTQTSKSVPLRLLIGELMDQLSDLVSVETRLWRAELAESSAKALSGMGWLVGGLCLLVGAMMMLLAATAALLMRLGMPADLACLVVAVVTMIIGAILAILGLSAFRKANFIPKRSLRQIRCLGDIVKGS